MPNLRNTVTLLDEFLSNPQLADLRRDVFGGDTELFHTMLLEDYLGFSTAELTELDRAALVEGLTAAVRVFYHQVFGAVGELIGASGYPTFFKPLIETLPADAEWRQYLGEPTFRHTASWIIRPLSHLDSQVSNVEALVCGYLMLKGAQSLPAVKEIGFSVSKVLSVLEQAQP